MSKTRSWIVRCLIAVTALFLLGEDVERKPIDIFPPEPEDNHPKTPDPLPNDPEASDRFDQEVGITRPTRLILESPLSIIPPYQYQKPLSEAKMISKRIDDYLMAQAAFRKVQTGHVDPGWRNFSSRMEHYFQPKFEHSNDPTTEVSWAWFGKSLTDWLGDWYRSAGSRSKSLPYRFGNDRQYSANSGLFDLQKEVMHNSGYGTTFTTLVEIRFHKNEPISVTLVESSGQKKLDQEALQAAQKAAETITKLELPEEHGRALYALSTRYSILPPLPVINFGFDIMLGYYELFYPLKKMVNSRADLLAVFKR